MSIYAIIVVDTHLVSRCSARWHRKFELNMEVKEMTTKRKLKLRKDWKERVKYLYFYFLSQLKVNHMMKVIFSVEVIVLTAGLTFLNNVTVNYAKEPEEKINFKMDMREMVVVQKEILTSQEEKVEVKKTEPEPVVEVSQEEKEKVEVTVEEEPKIVYNGGKPSLKFYQMVVGEAMGETLEGKKAVVAVALNYAMENNMTLEEELTPNRFACIGQDGIVYLGTRPVVDADINEEIQEAVRAVLEDGEDPTADIGGAKYFYDYNYILHTYGEELANAELEKGNAKIIDSQIFFRDFPEFILN